MVANERHRVGVEQAGGYELILCLTNFDLPIVGGRLRIENGLAPAASYQDAEALIRIVSLNRPQAAAPAPA